MNKSHAVIPAQAGIQENDLPKDWQLVPLGKLRGGTAKSINPSEQPNKIFELYSVPSFSDGVPEVISGKEIGSSKRVVEPNTVLLSKINPRINRVWIVGPAGKHTQISSPEWVEFFPTSDVEPKYLMYFMRNYKFREHLSMNVSGVGGSLTRIRPKVAEDYEIPLAPPDQQKRIVAKIEELFSHIDAGIEALKKAKQLLKQYRQSVLKAAVTGELTREWREANKGKLEPASKLLERILKERRLKWEEQQLEQFKVKGKMPKDEKWKEKYKGPDVYNGTPLFELPEEWCWVYMGQLGNVIGGLTKNKKREKFKQQLPYLRVANVYANELRLDDVTQIGVKENELERILLEKGDLLIVEGNGSPEQIGRLAIWDGSIASCVHQNHLIKVRLQEKDCANYLMYWLSSLGGRDAILQVASSTSGLYTLSISKVSGLSVPLPPLEEQIEIYNLVSSKLSSIEHLEQEINVQLIKVEKNKQSILASAFSGMLWV